LLIVIQLIGINFEFIGITEFIVIILPSFTKFQRHLATNQMG